MMSRGLNRFLIRLVHGTILSVAILLISCGSSSERAKNENVLRKMLTDGSKQQDVEQRFGKGELVTNAVEVVRVRSNLHEGEARAIAERNFQLADR